MATRTALQQAIDTIEMLTNGLQWWIDHDKVGNANSSDDEALAEAAATIKKLQEELKVDTVSLVGIKDGVATNIGTVTTPPRMKLREIVRGYFGGDVDDEMSDAAMALAAGEDFLIWLMKNGWKAEAEVPTTEKKLLLMPSSKKKSVEEVLTQIANGTCDPTPTRRIYIDNPDAMKCDSWWQDYFARNNTTVKMLARHALELLNSK